MTRMRVLMRPLLVALLLAVPMLSLTGGALAAPQKGIDGKWNMTFTYADGTTVSGVMVLHGVPKHLKGTMTIEGRKLPGGGTLSGSNVSLSFSASRIFGADINGMVDGGFNIITAEGDYCVEKCSLGTWTGER